MLAEFKEVSKEVLDETVNISTSRKISMDLLIKQLTKEKDVVSEEENDSEIAFNFP